MEETGADRASRKAVERKKLVRIELHGKLLKGRNSCG
jgi:hypothetical protein